MTTSLIDQVSADNSKQDLLGREQFVDRMLSITEALSANKKNACYAINGRWGTGKTYVLSMFEERVKTIRISQEDYGEKYLVFRYNCWEYDYYDEPLVAITAAMLDSITEKTSILKPDVKEKFIGVLKEVGNGLLNTAAQIVETRTGLPTKSALSLFRKAKEAADENVKADKQYDHYSSFNKHLKQLKKEITELSAEKTVVILVDELDRCLPEYTIKVLERLHHLFYGVKNVQVILCLAHDQLEHTVRQIYGDGTNVGEYLKKFINFGIELDIGTIDAEVFDQRFNKYVGLFDGFAEGTTDKDVTDFKKTILEGIDIRNRIALVDKCDLIHSFVAKGEKKDFRYLCIELFLAVLDYCKIDFARARSRFQIDRVFDSQYVYEHNNSNVENPRTVTAGLTLLSEQYKAGCYPDGSHPIIRKRSFGGNDIEFDSLRGAILSTYRAILGVQDDVLYSRTFKEIETKAFIDYGKAFWEYLNTIR